MNLRFTKMHGLGNDFVVLDATKEPLALSSEQLQFLADRHFGVGCDQILQVEGPEHASNDFRYRIFNADGGEVEQCGNGARCFFRYVHERGLSEKNTLRVETQSGLIELTGDDDGRVTVNMGAPEFAPARIPFVAEAAAIEYDLQIDGPADASELKIAALSMGNPHAVLLVEQISGARVAELGPLIASHERFPRGVNAGFMQVVNRREIRVRVYERGAGETLACGSGACAALVAGRRWGLLEESVAVDLPGGRLNISWAGEGEPVMMTGPAETVFEGEIEL